MSDGLVRAWYRGHWALSLLAPLAGVYRLVTALRRLAYKRGWLASARFPVPVVVIGNITLGGTGKTPLTLALVKHLQSQGWRPAVVSRGYGGQARVPTPVSVDSSAVEVGDEPLLMARDSGVPVVVAPRRAEAVAWLVERKLCDIVVCDDGLQHYALARDLEIVVIDGERGLGNGHLLPWGPLRESGARLATADLVVVNGGSGDWPKAWPMTLAPGPWQALGGQDTPPPEPPAVVHAVAGIGNPERFFRALEQRGFQVRRHPFPDHHAFQPGDLAFGDTLPIVMTAKDAVKCQPFCNSSAWQAPVVATLSAEFYQRFDRQLAEVRRRKALASSLVNS